MSEAFDQDQLRAQVFVPRPRVTLESVLQPVEPIFEFPKTLTGIEPEQLRTYDRRALEVLGSRGIEGAFNVLDRWVSSPYGTNKVYEKALTEVADSQALLVHQAARYISKLRLMAVLDSDLLPYSKLQYKKFAKFREHSRIAERQPNERVLYKRVQTARISITADKIYKGIQDPRPYMEKRQAVIDESARRLREKHAAQAQPRRTTSQLVQRRLTELSE